MDSITGLSELFGDPHLNLDYYTGWGGGLNLTLRPPGAGRRKFRLEITRTTLCPLLLKWKHEEASVLAVSVRKQNVSFGDFHLMGG